jgi:sirohydrochlorin cobaltochelatase
MPNSIAPALEAALTDRFHFGQILVRKINGGFVLLHRDDEFRKELQVFRRPEDVLEITRYDDSGNYRPLKTAPNLRHVWRLDLATLDELKRALDYFYPGRLAVFAAWKNGQLRTTPLRDTLDRQTGMYRVAAKISEEQIDSVVGNFCRSDSGCLRTILWKRDKRGTVASTKLPPEKFDPAYDQTGPGGQVIPLLCQESCNLLVNECRKAVKGE